MMILISAISFLACLIPMGYLFLLAFASLKSPARSTPGEIGPTRRFAIVIPAHDESGVIGDTVKRLHNVNYPQDLYSIHIIADHCTDLTAVNARMAGAIVHERNDGPRTGKGAALSWGLNQVLTDPQIDAVIIFDADTIVDPQFLRIMNDRLNRGDLVIQGQHIISNPDKGWFPALTWAMFIVDNRFQNLGRSNLGWSAKNMGDSICFRSVVLRKSGWGEGLTEDYQLRQRLLLDGVKISYEPSAKGYGEAPLTWSQARAQRMRWLRGTYDSSQQFTRNLLVEGFKRKDPAVLDGGLQTLFPSFSTLTVISTFLLLTQFFLNWIFDSLIPMGLILAWASLVGISFLYPFWGLLLERAPVRAYLAMLSGPLFIAWRTMLALKARMSRRPVPWIRTAHGER